MKYRQYFGLNWQEFLRTPPEVFYTDMDMISVETEMQELHEKKIQSSSAK